MNTRYRTRFPDGRAIVLAAALTALPAMAADDLPAFQPGLWSFTITVQAQGAVKPQVQTLHRCANPTEDIRRKWQVLASKTCKFSPVAHDGKRYTYSSTCQKDQMLLNMKAVIIVESDQAYQVDTESRTNNQVRRESVVAKREGECTKPSSGHLPVPLPRKNSGT
jgi:uncharacterized protein affecting Mg2+/Co2+ transport